jgi:hypothetical protein
MLTQAQKARKNIKLLEEADALAIPKLDNPKYKKILTEQEKQLHHYLAQYVDPNYLPKSIAKEYEFPKYFYYTTNSKKHGIMNKRTRTDSAMFKRLMKNKTKLDQAKAQGIFKITEEPIKINIELNTKTKTKKDKDLSDLLGNVGFSSSNVEVDPNRLKRYNKDPNYYDTGKIKASKKEIYPDYVETIFESTPSHAPIKKNITIKKRTQSSAKKSNTINKILEEFFKVGNIDQRSEIHHGDRSSQNKKPNTKKENSATNIILDTTNDYTILGVSEGSSESEIKKAYKKLARVLHPDKTGGDSELTKKFIIVDDAYRRIMSDINLEDPTIQQREYLEQLIDDRNMQIDKIKQKIDYLMSTLTYEKSSRKKKQIKAELAELLGKLQTNQKIIDDSLSAISSL